MGGVRLMLFGAKGGCQNCACVPCNVCEKTCTEPHTGDAFEVVYTRYFEGAEAGNTTDDYLTATGDSDTSDPFDGMDGDGPWYQRVSGGFTFSPTGTRFPCSIRVSFWRNSYTLGPNTVPPPAATLTENTIEVIVDEGELVAPDGTIITPADGVVGVSSVPLVPAGGDASTADPRMLGGTVSFAPQCNNVETTFTIRATIRWNTKQRQHVLYGLVRECYEEETPAGCCESGETLQSSLYVTISGYSYPGGKAPAASAVNGTYVVDRFPLMCSGYALNVAGNCEIPYGQSSMAYWSELVINSTSYALEMRRYALRGDSGCVWIFLASDQLTGAKVCDAGSNPISSGTGKVYASTTEYAYDTTTQVGTFNWEIES